VASEESGTRGLGAPVVEEEEVTAVEEESGSTRGLAAVWRTESGKMSHPIFKAKTRCSSYVYPGSSCHTYGQNVST
jgi:hypothetical protein